MNIVIAVIFIIAAVSFGWNAYGLFKIELSPTYQILGYINVLISVVCAGFGFLIAKKIR